MFHDPVVEQHPIDVEKMDYISHMYSIRSKEMLNPKVHKAPSQGGAMMNRFVFKVVWKPEEHND